MNTNTYASHEPSSTPATAEALEIDALDFLLTLAENWKLLVFIPLVAGLAAFGIGFALPQTFESTSVLSVERPNSRLTAPLVASLAQSADVLDQLLPKAGFDAQLSPTQARKELQKQLQVNVGKQDKLLTIITRASTPQAAQQLNQALLALVYPLTRPKGLEKSQLKAQLTGEKKRLAEASQLEQETAAQLASGRVTEATSRLYGELLGANSARQRRIAELELQLAGLGTDDLTQTPTLTEQAVKPKKAFIAMVTTLLSGMVLLFFVLARQALNTVRQSSPEQAAKIASIRQALPW
ncbi:Wzz/FepE/Etk N-terminal domain-containing protein [Comamonas composti]|uniref:Wzz/FepE/Etk N-terminal domain-containing protein n=1 Tax=Comamonas composti TaxID=408558 RepID=UPI0004189D7E|nr:Wzz/FepE/Etk N-terminal domain-containing protein [Comamonas composti]